MDFKAQEDFCTWTTGPWRGGEGQMLGQSQFLLHGCDSKPILPFLFPALCPLTSGSGQAGVKL